MPFCRWILLGFLALNILPVSAQELLKCVNAADSSPSGNYTQKWAAYEKLLLDNGYGKKGKISYKEHIRFLVDIENNRARLNNVSRLEAQESLGLDAVADTSGKAVLETLTNCYYNSTYPVDGFFSLPNYYLFFYVTNEGYKGKNFQYPGTLSSVFSSELKPWLLVDKIYQASFLDGVLPSIIWFYHDEKTP